MIKVILNNAFVVFLMLYSCINNQAIEKKSNQRYGNDYLHNKSPKVVSLEVIEYRASTDTFLVISTSSFMYYPFGSFNDINDFSRKYSFMEKSVEYIHPYKDTDEAKVPVYKFSYKKSYIKIFYDTNKKRFELVAAKIYDSEINLINFVHTGITKSVFFKKFSPEIKSEPEVKVIKFVSGVDGVWHYYTFKNEILVSLIIDTDYQFNTD